MGQRWSEMDPRDGRFYVDATGSLVAAGPKTATVFVVNQKGTMYYKIGYVIDDSVSRVVALAEEGSPLPLVIVDQITVPRKSIDAFVGEAEERLLNSGSPMEDGWVKIDNTEFHLQGQHDQASHGSWATGLGDVGDGEVFFSKRGFLSRLVDAAVPGKWSPRSQREYIAEHGKANWVSTLGTGSSREASSRAVDNCVGPRCGVYVIRAGNSNRYKIGKTVNLDSRLKALQTGSPEKLTVVAFHDAPRGKISSIEKALHKKYAAHKITGAGSANEWFEINEGEW